MVSVGFVLFSIFLFSYFGWKGAKGGDYKKTDLMAYLWIAPVVFVVFARIFQIFIFWNVWDLRLLDMVGFWRKIGFELGAGYMVLFLFSLYYAFAKGWKIHFFLEDMRKAFLVLILVWNFYILAAENSFEWLRLVLVVVVMVTLLVDLWMAKKYRSFFLYPSGKKGFMFWFDHFLQSLLMSVASLVLQNYVYTVIFGMISLSTLVVNVIRGKNDK